MDLEVRSIGANKDSLISPNAMLGGGQSVRFGGKSISVFTAAASSSGFMGCLSMTLYCNRLTALW